MSGRISQALSRLFDKHRIVFWYDTKHELRGDFEAVSIPDVEKAEIANNEYGLKHRILRESPEQKFLLYKEGPQPEDLDNWLLDVQLAHGEFRTDQAAIWLSELELGLEFAEVAQAHAEFFQANKRKEALKKLLKPDDTAGQLRLKMLAVCAGSEPRMDSVVETLLQQLAEGRDDGIRLIERCGLDSFWWEQLTRFYGYEAIEPSLRDFVIELFKSCYAMGTDGEVKLTGDALVFLKRWKDSRQFEQGFETLSAECAEVLGIEQDLGKRDLRDLVELDYFRLIDQKIISDLVRAVVGRTVTSGDVALWVRQRRQGHWYGEFRHLYEAIEFAARFVQMLGEARLTMDSLSDGVQRYTRTWFQLDQLYRKFTYHVRMSGQASLMGELSEQVENLYSNNYLLKLGDGFQVHVDAVPRWEAYPVVQQKAFFEHWVRPYLRKDKRICVIISDAMRYEIGDELLGFIRQEDRYSAELEPALSTLPSYTQLGMAALLPNKSLAIADNDTGTVLVDGQSSQGTANRTKILRAALDGRGQAVKAEDFMQLNRDDSRELLKGNDVVYIYHNRIDHTGDKMHSEGQAFEAAEQTLADLIRLIKKLTAANANNLLITADHGFIYQNRELDESDFLGDAVSGDDIRYRDRRFVLGKGLSTSPAFHHFSSEQLGLDGEMEVQIPKSINRLRLKGSGSRFVHGGASLQEVVIPVLKVNKKRQSDVSAVEVDILRGASSVITSGQLAVTLYQSGPVTEKVQPRHLRAGIYTQSGELISDSHELSFDLTSENPRERELQVRFVLSRKADEANGQEVFLRLDEQHAGTSHYKEYKSLRYLMRRSFTSDFDF
ncbi:BREX-1 system phosphatase PglZ type A [Hydrocarboniclastica marina]|uniref:BREX-1 system phosphatase PglZ type A n=1 Tax=Hydrocarboniclastica marina TaxID=2259620 RepID=A0A4P7XKH6_9ALTE|nr:BREX-1 system phosphatase PglZ type A [Hydrocarboniclastica marina]QCF27726.1 BREX-1 system phosphatase PglZ type A [Hydrocarboniclastica marina]